MSRENYLSIENSSEDSDVELQEAFARGDLKPGLNIEVSQQKPHVNNTAGLEAKLKDFYLKLEWVERLDQTNEPVDPEDASSASTTDKADNDFQRELLFYRQAQATVLEALPKLRKYGIPTRRPEDYFAEMAKSDVHMKKVREKLLSKEIGMERSEKAKKIRQLRKYGKKVQQNVLLQRQKEKKDMIDSVKKYRKGQINKLDFLDDDVEQKGNKGQKRKGSGVKRNQRNEKFGFGGQKKWSKRNTSESAAGPTRNKGTKSNRKMNKRPGKSSRQKIKAKRR